MSLTLDSIQDNLARLRTYLQPTPIWTVAQESLPETLAAAEMEVVLKLELLQRSGSFKIRGVLTSLLNLSEEQLARGVVAASGGNHAVAVALGASLFNLSAKVVIPATANALRQKRCAQPGVQTIIVPALSDVFSAAQAIAAEEQRYFIHPFEGPDIALGSATLGLEFFQQVPNLEAVVIAIGGGGLCAGVASACRLLNPQLRIYGVEPEGADAMRRSLMAGHPVRLARVNTIADSLAPPHTEAYSFRLCQQALDDIVTVTDEQLRRSMQWYFEALKLVVEPAGAATIAALNSPALASRLKGKRVGAIVCGSNIDLLSFASLLSPRQEDGVKKIAGAKSN